MKRAFEWCIAMPILILMRQSLQLICLFSQLPVIKIVVWVPVTTKLCKKGWAIFSHQCQKCVHILHLCEVSTGTYKQAKWNKFLQKFIKKIYGTTVFLKILLKKIKEENLISRICPYENVELKCTYVYLGNRAHGF